MSEVYHDGIYLKVDLNYSGSYIVMGRLLEILSNERSMMGVIQDSGRTCGSVKKHSGRAGPRGGACWATAPGLANRRGPCKLSFEAGNEIDAGKTSGNFCYSKRENTGPALRGRFPRLFHLARNSDGVVRDFWLDNQWQMRWIRQVTGGVAAFQMAQLQDLLATVQVRDLPDKWRWELNGSLEFSVAAIRAHLDASTLPTGASPTRWNRFVPIKINVFAWRVAFNRLPTRLNLEQKCIDVDTIMCPVCQREVESLAHILFKCEVAFAVWGRVANSYYAYMPVFDSFGEMTQWVDAQSNTNDRRAKVDVVCCTAMWVLWKFRNGMVFGDPKSKRDMLFDSIVSFSFNWFCNRNSKHSRNWNAWMICPLRN
ncbi:hypothetical protein LXL04_004514 [Taraxacum kok-saghyz]